MSLFEIAEVKPGRPSKPDPFRALDDIFTEAQVNEARTVCLKTAEGLTDEQKKRIAQKAKGALKRYAAARGGLAGEIGFNILEGAVELWFTKRKARKASAVDAPPGGDPEPEKANTGRKRAAAGASE